MKKICAGMVVAALAAFMGVSSGRATITVYTDEASWAAAAGTSSLETFSSSPVGALSTSGAYSLSSYNHFGLSGNGNGDTVGIYQGGIANSGDNNPIPGSFLGQNYVEWGNTGDGGVGATTTFTFTPATAAFGFDWFNTDVSDQYQLVVNGNTYAGPPFTVGTVGTQTGFFGVVATGETISTATISNQFNGGYISDEGFDNVRVAGAMAAPAPEPGTMALTGLAMLGIGAACRKRFRARVG